MWLRVLAVTAVILTSAVPVALLAADEIHEGKVTAVSDGKLMVLDSRDDDNDSFVVTAETKITRNGKPAKLSDIQVGDKAKVSATSRDGMLIAKEIAAVAPQ